jgi:hypothetical protein
VYYVRYIPFLLVAVEISFVHVPAPTPARRSLFHGVIFSLTLDHFLAADDHSSPLHRYVNPEKGVRARRDDLRTWNWGLCECARCVKEARELAAAEKARAKERKEKGEGTEGEGEEIDLPVNGEEEEIDVAELERELKETLGF